MGLLDSWKVSLWYYSFSSSFLLLCLITNATTATSATTLVGLWLLLPCETFIPFLQSSDPHQSPWMAGPCCHQTHHRSLEHQNLKASGRILGTPGTSTKIYQIWWLVYLGQKPLYIFLHTQICVCTSYSCGCATFRRAQMKFLMEGWLVILPMLPPTLSPFKEKHTAEKIGTPFQKITEAFLPSSGHRCVSKKIALPWSSPSKSPVKSAPSKAL